MTPLANHLWQSTLFAGAVWLLTLAFRNNRAAVRYGLWLAASVKFLIPFSPLVSLGSQFGRRTAIVFAAPSFPSVMSEIGQPFNASAVQATAAQPSPDYLPIILLTLWACGIVAGLIFWAHSLTRMRAIRRAAVPFPIPSIIPVLSSPARIEPGIFGIRSPVLILPAGIAGRLAPAQLAAVLAHEMAHVRRKDNLTAALHLLTETIFWFYPLLWWIRKRLVAERERACDEAVIAQATDPHVYAQAILNVCQLYIESPLVCVSGIAGADLKRRIETIMADQATQSLSSGRKFLLAMAAIAALAAPLLLGLQTDSHPAAFDAASIKPAGIPLEHEGGNRSKIEYSPISLTMWNVGLSECVEWAYGVASFQIAGQNVSSDSYDILAKAGGPVPVGQLKAMLQDLLANRFKLALHRESRMLPVYELLIAKGGPNLPPANSGVSRPANHSAESLPRVRGDSFVFQDASLAEFAAKLTQLRGIDFPVVDRTGIQGTFDIVLKSAPSAARQGDGPGLAAIVQEQLGLKLAPAKAPIEVLVIDHAEKPSEN